MTIVRTRTRRTLAFVSVAGLLLAASACGGNDKNPSGGASADPNVKFSGDPVTVMTMAPYDNDILEAKVMLDISQGAVTYLNNQGGLNGHEIKLITCNEGADPNKAQACAREAVDKKVSALVGGFTLSGDTVMPILEAAGIPWVGPPGISTGELSSKDSFPVTSGVLGLAGLGRKAAEDGCDKVAAVNFDQPSSSQIASLIDVGLSSEGHGPSTAIKVPPTTADYASIAQQVSDYDCAVVGTPPQAMTGIVAAGQSLGMKTRLYLIGGGLTSTVTDQLGSSIDGAVSYSPFPVGDDKVWDAGKKAVGDLSSDASGGWSGVFQQNTWVAWIAFANVLKNNTDLSAKGILSTLNQTDNVDTAGFTPSFSFTSEYPVPGLARVFNHQIIYVKVDGSKIVADGGYQDLSPALTPAG